MGKQTIFFDKDDSLSGLDVIKDALTVIILNSDILLGRLGKGSPSEYRDLLNRIKTESWKIDEALNLFIRENEALKSDRG